MKFMKYLFIFCFISNAFATEHYKPIPLTLSMASNDSLIVNYDFSEKKGVYCTTSSENEAKILFVYKGFQKSADLPVNLESDHVPVKKHEELADLKGQFTIIFKHTNDQMAQVHCDYME